MNVDLSKSPAIERLPEVLSQTSQHAASAFAEAAQQANGSAREAVQHVTDAARDAAQHATDSAKEMCHSMSEKLEETVVGAKAQMRQNPLPFVLGALAFGVAVGYMIVMTRREEQTFRNRYIDEPLHSAREAIYAALAPVAHSLHGGYDSARGGVGKALDKMHDLHPERRIHSWSDQLSRVGKNLKFW